MATPTTIEELIDLNPPSVTDYSRGWKYLPVEKIQDTKLRQLAFRLNALGSSHYFGKVVLRRHRLNDTLHKDMCNSIERSAIKDVIEIPRDHFKSTIFSEIAPMWWALPLSAADIEAMVQLGYDEAWIRWMRRSHNQDTRTLLVSSVIDNAIKLGTRVKFHYENNDFFRALFPEILPTPQSPWNAKSLTHNRTKASPNGEGTFDFIGVGGALQSRHYDRVVQDDLVGKEIIEAKDDSVMQGTIDYHRLLPGAFDSDPSDPNATNDELVVGNRWAIKDLNYYIRKEEPFFNFQTHSLKGGCCSKHPYGQYIFPEEWGPRKEAEYKIRFGVHFFSCQYLNNPIPDGATEFDPTWLRFYNLEAMSEDDRRAKIVHEVKDGEVVSDILCNNLNISMVVDPNHAGDKGRCRHAITVIGYTSNPTRLYLLDLWAEAANFHSLVDKIYEFATKWKLSEFWLETIAAQKYLKFYLEYKNRVTGRSLRVNELKTDHTANAKAQRIRSMNPYFAEGQFWCRRTAHQDFIEEYSKFPYGDTVDILDTIGYAPQTWTRIKTPIETMAALIHNRNSFTQRQSSSVTGY